MKKLIFMGVMGLFLLGSCNSKSGHDHEGHDHGTEESHDTIMKVMTTRVKVTKDIITERKLQQPVTLMKLSWLPKKRKQPE